MSIEDININYTENTDSILVRNNISTKPWKTSLITSITILVLLLTWEVITFFEWIQPLYLPSPQAVIYKLWDVATEGYMDSTLGQHLIASLMRIGLALLIAIIIAIPVGLAIGLSTTARAIFDPLIEFYRPVPPLAYLPLIVIWFGIGELSKVLLIFLAIFAPIVVSTAAGVLRIDKVRIRMAQSLGGNRWQIVRYIIIPSVLPDILTGIRIGLGAGWSTLVAAELIAATQGLGYMIQSASQFLITDLVIAGISVIAIIAYVLEILLRYLQKKLVPWQGLSH